MIRKKISLNFFFFFFIIAIVSFGVKTEASVKNNLLNSENKRIYTYAEAGNEKTKIYPIEKNEEIVFILPSAVKPESVALFRENSKNIGYVKGELKKTAISSGELINLNDYCKDNNYSVSVKFNNKEKTVKFLFSENVPSVFLISENPQTNGRLWVEASYEKENKAKGEVVVQQADGSISYEGKLTQIKGRGNSTWWEAKKPYQIKTEEKSDLLNSGKTENLSKTWVLLANYFDSSVLNNFYATRIGKELGPGVSIENCHVDLFYDGEYRGSYLLSEKVEVGKGRVNVEDLEDKNQIANENINIEAQPIASSTTENGAFFTYCEGVSSPEDITGGYLLEMDFEVRALEEISYFRTTRGQYVVVKSPEFATKEEMNYIATLYQEYEDAVYNGGINPSTGKSYSDYVDKESIATYYLVNELSKARDFFASSAYLYKDAGEEKMYMGPLWDYDLSFGKSRYERKEEEPPLGENIYNTIFGRKLLGIRDFSSLLNKKYEKELYPLIKNVIMGNERDVSESGITHSISYEKKRLKKTAECNNYLWYDAKSWEDDVNGFYDFIFQRAEFLKGAFASYTERESGREDLFGDVPPERWFFDEVMQVAAKDYMKNVYNTFFDPYSKVKRVEAAQIIFNVSGENLPSFKKIYKDINENDYYSPLPVVWASEKGILEGYPDGNFYPYGFVSREEMATILYRYENKPDCGDDISESFADKESVSPYAKKAVCWAIENGLLKGDNRGYLNPQGTITRAELAAVIARFSANKG